MIKKILVCTLSVAIFTTAIAKADTPPACPTGQDARILANNILSVPGQGADCDDNIYPTQMKMRIWASHFATILSRSSLKKQAK